jgi:hypothetical protein
VSLLHATVGNSSMPGLGDPSYRPMNADPIMHDEVERYVAEQAATHAVLPRPRGSHPRCPNALAECARANTCSNTNWRGRVSTMRLHKIAFALLSVLLAVGLAPRAALADSALQASLSARFLGGKISGEQVLKSIHKDFDPGTMKTGQKTDVNTKYRSGPDKAPKDELVGFFKIAEPAFMPDHLLVLEILSDATDGSSGRGFFSLLKGEGQNPKVIAREPIVADPSSKDQALSWYGGGNGRSGLELTFELANYKLNDSERAFGYRLKTWDGGTGADSGDETIVLYRRTSQGLAEVFRATLASHESEWDNAENKTYTDVETKAILSVASTTHDGFYDWLVKGKTINKKTKGGWKPLQVQTYVWKDGRYVLEGKAQ